jgi:hypothetical protein
MILLSAHATVTILISAADLVQGEHTDHNDTKHARHRKEKGAGPRLQLCVSAGEGKELAGGQTPFRSWGT